MGGRAGFVVAVVAVVEVVVVVVGDGRRAQWVTCACA